jgi:hypothetical protein
LPDGIVRNGTATGLKVIADRAIHEFAGPRNIPMVNVDTLAGAVTAMQTRYASVTRAAIAAFHPDRSLLLATRTTPDRSANPPRRAGPSSCIALRGPLLSRCR